MTIPQTVIQKDHDLEGRVESSSFALAEHRWQQTLDPDGPQHAFSEYARAVGRSHTTISRYASGYAIHVDCAPGAQMTITDAIRLAGQSAEQQAFTEAIAEGLNQPVANVARGDNTERRDIIAVASERAERRGTDAVEEAGNVARERAAAREANRSRNDQHRSRRSIRFLAIEGHLAQAKSRLVAALSEANGVDFTDEEMELLRSSVAAVKAVLDLLDLRVAGEPDIDWDAELSNLAAQS